MFGFFTTTLLLNFQETDVRVEFDYTPATPGKTFGPPEDCYPPEAADVELLAVLSGATDLTRVLSQEQLKELQERALFEGSLRAEDEAPRRRHRGF